MKERWTAAKPLVYQQIASEIQSGLDREAQARAEAEFIEHLFDKSAKRLKAKNDYF